MGRRRIASDGSAENKFTKYNTRRWFNSAYHDILIRNHIEGLYFKKKKLDRVVYRVEDDYWRGNLRF